ncbi:hypothetical protein BDZ89DRAFT_1066595 [Hymenopellis radicata]|nr:hypothetical protein BDZ89DRAFT_1066595 [Hymenopellis radicata]
MDDLLPLSPSSTCSLALTESDIDLIDLEEWGPWQLEEDGEPEHKRIEDLDSGLAALRALVPNDWSSANPCAAEVLDITCQYIKHQKKNERKNIATWEREIAALRAHAESLEEKCEELSKDKESLARELERVKGSN